MDFFIIASCDITNTEVSQKLRKMWENSDSKNYMGRSKEDTMAIPREKMEGSIALLHPKTYDIIKEIKINCPYGTLFLKKLGLLVGSGNSIKIIKKGKIEDNLHNQMFNDIHGISLSMDGNIWVCSTGVDALIKIDPQNSEKILRCWLATENGYNISANGKSRNVKRYINHQKNSYHTPIHTTHINSSLEIKPGKILATLFHQGELVEIDLRTGKTNSIISGMEQPHAVIKSSFGYICSDTSKGRIICLNENLERIKEIFLGKNKKCWLQYAIELPNKKLLVSDNTGWFGKLICLDNRGKVKEVKNYSDEGRNILSMSIATTDEVKEIFGSF